jgi:NAD(P)-dependent dehydrogenase (short-subunit alcohol dehydrogenase family)
MARIDRVGNLRTEAGMELDGRIALVTGVGKDTGIGFAVASALAGAGAHVIVTARTGAQAQAMAGRIGQGAEAIALDIGDRASVAAAAEAVTARHGHLDILISNAAAPGIWGQGAGTADLDAVRGTLDVTLLGTWAVAQAFLPLLRLSDAGRLVHVSSGAGSHGDTAFGLTSGNAMGAGYGVAKAGVNALTALLAAEEESGVKINAVCPGFTATFPGGEQMGARPPAESVPGILWAATLPGDGPTGGFFRDGQPLPW